MVDTGAMVSLIKPNISEAQLGACKVQARGVSGTQMYPENKKYNLVFELEINV
jgi:hypothetical protein